MLSKFDAKIQSVCFGNPVMIISEPYSFSCCECHVRAFLSGCYDDANSSQGALYDRCQVKQRQQNSLLLLSCVRPNISVQHAKIWAARCSMAILSSKGLRLADRITKARLNEGPD
jgi:hypothetical protein